MRIENQEFHISMLDYYEKYKNYSNIELLKIIKSANEHHKEAVKAAADALSLRDVSDEEITETSEYYQEKHNESNLKKMIKKRKQTPIFRLLSIFFNL